MKAKEQKLNIIPVWILAAFLFLFNPNVNIVDVLPDFVGYAILLAALSRLSSLNGEIALSHRGFLYAAIADLAKFVCIFLVFSSQNPVEQNTLLLLCSFAFAVIELVILIPAYSRLFGGLIGLGYKYSNTSVLGYKTARQRKNFTEKIRSFTLFFLVFKVLAYTLPEFAVLSTHTYDDTSRVLYIYDFIGLLRSFAIVASLVVGVVWLFKIRGYFVRVRKDSAFSEALADDYKVNVLPRTSLFVRREVKLMSLFFVVAALLCIDFRIEGFNLIFDTLAAVFLLLSAFAIKKHIGGVRKSMIAFAVYAVASILAIIFEFRFFGEHYYSAIWRDDAAFSSYCVMLVFSVIDALGFLAAAWGMSSMLLRIVNDHTGFAVPSANLNVEDKIKRVHGELKKKIYLFLGVAVLAGAADIFYDFGAHAFEFAGFVNAVCSVAFVFAVFYVTNAVDEEVEAKYMLE